VTLKALIVEDGPSFAELLAKVATEAGLEVVANVQTEDAALLACERFAVDLAVVDLQLAQGTGFGVIRTLRGKSATRPASVIVITNHAVPALKVAAFEAGADYFLDKCQGVEPLRRVLADLHARTAA
jgi:DNA-binding response OmpR family regulator